MLWAEQPCPTASDESHPIGDIRTDGVFTTSHLACEEDNPEFFIQDKRTLLSIDNDVGDFCSQFEDTTSLPSSTGVCTNRLFNFVEHGERIEDFVDHLSVTLQNTIELPAGLSVREEDANHVRALMYLCTRYKIDQAERVLNSDASDEEKIRFISALAQIGILGNYLRDSQGRDFLTSENISEQVRTHAITSLLNSPSSTNEQIDFLINWHTKLAGQQQRNQRNQLFFDILDSSFRNYLTLEPTQQSDRALSQLSLAGFEGAAAAVDRFVSAQNITPTTETADAPEVPVPSPGISVTPISPQATFPVCSDLEPINNIEQQQVVSILNDYLARRSQEDNFPEARDSINLWSWYSDVFQQESLWPGIELHLDANSNTRGDNLIAGRKFYCFVTQVSEQFETLNQQIEQGSASSELANDIFLRISSANAHETFASMVATLAPYLNEENKLAAIDIIDNQIITGSSDEAENLRLWRFNALQTIINTHQGPQASPTMLRAVSAIANRGQEREETYLSELFSSTTNESLRNHILGQYSQASLINTAQGFPTIFSTISSIENQNQRNRYLSLLANSLSDLRIGSRNQNTDLATDTNVVTETVVNSMLTQIQNLSTDTELQQEIAVRLKESEGIVAGGTSPESEGVAPPVVAPIVAPIAAPGGGNGAGGGGRTLNLTNYRSKPNMIAGSFQSNQIPQNSFIGTQFPTGVKPGDLRGGGSDSSEAQEDGADSDLERNLERDEQQTQLISNDDSQPLNSAINGLAQTFTQGLSSATGLGPTSGNYVTSPYVPNTTSGRLGAVESKNSARSSLSDGRSVGDRLREFESNLASEESNSRQQRRRRESDQELLREIRQITEDTSNLRDRIDGLGVPQPSIANTANPNVNQTGISESIAANTDNSGQEAQAPSNASASSNTGRGPASVSNSSAAQGGTVNGGAAESSAVAGRGGDISQSLLSPYTDATEEDLSKIIVVRLEEEKALLRNYMSAKESMTCPELRFVQDFYEKNIDKFILSKRRKPWREYALLELDGMNFRFNYPGAIKMRESIKETCEALSGIKSSTVGQSNRAPAAGEPQELVPADSLPAQEEQGIIKRFMLKLGL